MKGERRKTEKVPCSPVDRPLIRLQSPEILPSLPLTAWRTSKKHHGLTDTGREEPPRGARCLGAEPRLGPALKRRTHHPPTLGRELRWEGLVGDKNVLPKASSCK